MCSSVCLCVYVCVIRLKQAVSNATDQKPSLTINVIKCVCCFCTVKCKMSAVYVVINWLTISVMFRLQRVNGSLRKATMIYYFSHVVFILVPICVSLCFVGESWLQMCLRLNPLNCRQFLGVYLCSHHIFTDRGIVFTAV